MSDIDFLGIALGGALIIGLLAYLGYVLIHPEQF
ncbi:K(+)-transporting ATPase subunit F [Magnetospirillum sulfuroxidans]|uniref:K(+)-transporting ATPase subunit F n=1 Tax=Magnetospirillum sulfuroxidans TaxID=611300 RepID=A0ABS5IGZ4_9PROT|nr:K(+)-transporting ATPase subunit F [Magnetospirillum sulfuroxidans]MBR9973685.1 K(+)-transporting ATPase subunit F [Magnetospirillum sulfuroxidans]